MAVCFVKKMVSDAHQRDLDRGFKVAKGPAIEIGDRAGRSRGGAWSRKSGDLAPPDPKPRKQAESRQVPRQEHDPHLPTHDVELSAVRTRKGGVSGLLKTIRRPDGTEYEKFVPTSTTVKHRGKTARDNGGHGREERSEHRKAVAEANRESAHGHGAGNGRKNKQKE